MLHLGAKLFVLAAAVICANQAGPRLGADALNLRRAVQGDLWLSSHRCLREGEACTAVSLSPGSVASANITLGGSFSLFLKEKQIQAEESDLQEPGTAKALLVARWGLRLPSSFSWRKAIVFSSVNGRLQRSNFISDSKRSQWREEQVTSEWIMFDDFSQTWL